ncbi:hypothetical protein [Catellatospora tritici]|uniref:hypothetical protein n=1 Tax=Catellatospora tritici TaxID=2851566 RepID=UPI001C2D0A87|nr:hypothetical protein [Catellatospora tritici]MBV1852696.1 hypothetical protein [Catellatospora tritici]
MDWFEHPPRRVFHTLLAAVLLWLLWVASGPGVLTLRIGGAVLTVALFGLVWLVRVGWSAVRRRRWSWWYPVAPLLVAATAVALATGAPLQSRWALSSDAFDRLVIALPVGADWTPFDVPTTVGAYRIDRAYRVPGGAVFEEANGSGVVDDAGFAYLPGGPTAALRRGGPYEGLIFRHLRGPWYTWTASW